MFRIKQRWSATPALALLVLAMAAGALADDFQIPLDRDGLPAWTNREWTDFPVRLVLPDHAALEELLERVPIAAFDRAQIAPEFSDGKIVRLVFTPRVTANEYAALAAAGLRPEKLHDVERENREASEALWRALAEGEMDAGTLQTYPLGYVPTNDQIGTMLQDIAAAHPTLARYYTWGTSVQGRTLHALAIAQDVHAAAARPQVRYSSSMHGDEITGLVLCLNMALYLVDRYGETGYEDVTDLVDNYELHLLPSHNPDGTNAGSRYNANGVDLNRNYPEPAGTHPVLQQENVAFIAHAQAHDFVISINYHGGALVMNYPWDYTYALTPDNDALIELCLEYSTRNLPMYNGSFPQGITNGAAWYIITGSLQDWSYDQTECIDITCEVSNTKWPSDGALPGFWTDNRDAMVAFARSARAGITGTVTDAGTGQPLAATVTVAGIDRPVSTRPAHGDYYKLLDSGTYMVTYEAVGYVAQTVTGLASTWGVENVVDVALQPLATGLVAGTVADLHGQGLDALVEFRTWPAGVLVQSVATWAAEGGAFSTDLFHGDYTVTASAPGLFSANEQIALGAEPIQLAFALAGAVVAYPVAEDFETGPGVFGGQWVLVGPGFESDQCLKTSVGSYPHSATLIAAMTEGISLAEVMAPAVTFRAKWSIESNWDAVFFEISTDGGAGWTPLAVPGLTRLASGQGAQIPAGAPCFDGNRTSWTLCTVDLAAYIGQPDVRLRFRLATDGSVTADGFYLDDFVVEVVTEEEPPTGVETPPALLAAVDAHPNPFNPATTVRLVNPRAGAVSVDVYDLQGRLVRTLVRAELPAGEHRVLWDGLSDEGRRAGSGVYLVHLVAGDRSAAAKVTIVK